MDLIYRSIIKKERLVWQICITCSSKGRWTQFAFDRVRFSRAWWTKLKKQLLLWWIRSYFLEAFPFFVWEAMKLNTSVSISTFFYSLYLIIEKDLYSFLFANVILRLFIPFSPFTFSSPFRRWGSLIFFCTLFTAMWCNLRPIFFGRPLRFGRMLYYLFCSF